MSIFTDWFSKNTDGVVQDADLSSLQPYARDMTILVVDDSKTVLVSVKKMLNRLGCQCLVADNAKEGIEIAEVHQPDLILMDVVMPEINGFQATRMLRNKPATRHIPIIIISGNKMQTEQLWGRRLGANGFLPKPLDPRELLALTEELVKTRQVAVS